MSLLLVLLNFFCADYASVKKQSESAIIDVPPNLVSEGAFQLNGPWEFYWNELITPADFKHNNYVPQYVQIGSWHRQGDFSVLGYGTYRIQLRFSENPGNLLLYFPIINSAAKIWLNGAFVDETGKVHADPNLYRAQLTGTIISLPAGIQSIEVIVQVVNYSYFSGGIVRTPIIEKSSALFRKFNRTNGVEDFFAGSLIAMFIYQLILYFLYHRGKPYLWLGLICLAVALRALVTHGGSFLLPHLFPSFEWEIWKKIEFGSVYAVVALFPLYVYHLFKQFAPRKPIILFVIVSAFLCLAVLATPQYVYGKLLEVCHIMLLLSFIYAVYSISMAWRSGADDAKVILLGVLASFPFILAEILKNSLLYPLNIEFMYLVELGVLVFLLFQVYLLANHYAKSYRHLEELNLTLENKVEERTKELRTANTVKDRLLSVMSHDIKSPLNSLRGILQIYNMGAITKEEFDAFSVHVENDLNKTSMLVENILYWTASQLKGIQVNKETFNIQVVLNENFQLFQTIASNKKVKLIHHVHSPFLIKTDRNILNLVLRNLIANAIKFSHEGGEIEVFVREDTNFFVIEVKDQGVGMDDNTLRKLLGSEVTISKQGTGNEKGTGLGLDLCSVYLGKAGGSITAESQEGKGSTFRVLLPV